MHGHVLPSVSVTQHDPWHQSQPAHASTTNFLIQSFIRPASFSRGRARPRLRAAWKAAPHRELRDWTVKKIALGGVTDGKRRLRGRSGQWPVREDSGTAATPSTPGR